MSRTIRKDRRDVEYPEGQYNIDLHVYKCRCEYCRGKNNRKANSHKKEYQKELQEIV